MGRLEIEARQLEELERRAKLARAPWSAVTRVPEERVPMAAQPVHAVHTVPPKPKEALGDRLMAVELVREDGRTERVRISSRSEQLRTAYWGMRITFMVMATLALLLFHDSILEAIGQKVGQNAVPIARGAWQGYWGQ
ncbi:hypothetical protein JL101_035930 (plasmid) [Skermanella rosea]|uniref:hypothetical protein n=1 Tax=Skermanella rosea TaxID=1817965 RepID=UPI001933CE00|nr:hypothetical protein [Skermanella rosea]UEM08043.1 hypothetical protein JL101_035930 [Skermanella rosea]